MKVEIKLPFGLNEKNILVHIDDAERGKKCGCICPSCRSPLIAAQGSARQHHFKHSTGHECENGLESAIHLAAKQILMERKQITLPECVARVSLKDSRGTEYAEKKIIVDAGTLINFHSVQEEVELNGMKADILATRADTQLIIEVFYRNKVNDQKLHKIAEANISAIEIDLSDLTPESVKDWDSFWAFVNDPQRMRWLYNAKEHDLKREFEKQLRGKLQVQEKQYEREEIEKHRQAEREKTQVLKALDNLKILRGNEHIAKLSQEAEIHPIWRKYRKHLPFSWNELPNFLNVVIADGDWIFGCDRRIWQVAFYSAFICKMGGSFSIERVDSWLQKSGCNVPCSVKTVRMFYGRRYPQLPPADIPSPWRTLRAYFWHLCELGMLEDSGDDRKHPGSLWFRVISKNTRCF